MSGNLSPQSSIDVVNMFDVIMSTLKLFRVKFSRHVIIRSHT